MKRILVVEDEADVRSLLEVAFEDSPFEALIVAGAGPALQALERERLDALVTNINLGETLTGFDVARRAVARMPDLPVIYVTGAAAHQFEGERVNGGVLLTKPYLPNTLIETIDGLLTAGSESAGAAVLGDDARGAPGGG